LVDASQQAGQGLGAVKSLRLLSRRCHGVSSMLWIFEYCFAGADIIRL
jgi:hypothetical protein